MTPTPSIRDRVRARHTPMTPDPTPADLAAEDAAVSAFLSGGGAVERIPRDPALSVAHQWRRPAVVPTHNPRDDQ